MTLASAAPPAVTPEQTKVVTTSTQSQPATFQEPAPPVFCGYCGTRNHSDAKLCSHCHRALEVKTTADSAQRTCPRCGRVQDASRKSCYHCGVHFVRSETMTYGPLRRKTTGRPPNEMQRAATIVLGCIWASFAAMLLLIILVALLSR
ncbi:MAG: zinc ribbon domain-containing protein [Candidatus Zipacnadales bacterium]